MKLAMMILTLTLTTTNALALEDLSLNFTDDTKVEKTVMKQEILLKNLINLHKNIDFEGKRMIAGQFEGKKKSKKNTYVDGLRSKLDSSSGYSRF